MPFSKDLKRFKTLEISCLTVFLCFSKVTPAATLTVGPEAEHGSIQAAVNVASTGDIISIAPGTFTENLIIKSSGITLIGAGQGQTILIGGIRTGAHNDISISSLQIRGGHNWGDDGNDDPGIWLERNTHGHRLSDLTLDGTGHTASARGILFTINGVEDVAVTDVEVFGWHTGVYVNPGSRDTVFTRYTGRAGGNISVDGPLDDVIIQDSSFIDDGIGMSDYQSPPGLASLQIINTSFSGSGPSLSFWDSQSAGWANDPVTVKDSDFTSDVPLLLSRNTAWADPLPGTTAISGLFFDNSNNTITVAPDSSMPESIQPLHAAVLLAGNGGEIQAQSGTYALAQTLVIEQPLALLGAQAGVDPRTDAALRTPGSANESIIDGQDTVSTLIRILSDNVTIEGFDLASGTGDLITSSSSSTIASPVIRYNFVHDSSGDEGMQIRNSSSALIEYNRVFNTAGDGINLAGDGVGGTVSSQNGIIRFNEIHDTHSPDGAIYLYGSVDNTIQGNLVYNVNNNDGIKLGDKTGNDAALSGGSITDNIIGNSVQDSISVYMSDVTVSGNEVFNSSSANGAIFIDFAVSDVSVTANSIHDNGSADDSNLTFGIRVGKDSSPANVTISGNSFADNEAQVFHKRHAVSNAGTLTVDNTFDDTATAGVTLTVGAVFGDPAGIAEAVALAEAGETILVNSGSYGRVSLDKPVTLLSAHGAAHTTITGNGVSQGWGLRLTDSADGARVGAAERGFTINTAAGDLAALYLVGNNSDVVISGNVLNGGAGHALLTGGGLNQVSITENTLTGNGPKAVAYANGQASLGSTRGSSQVDFINNLIKGNSGAGLLLGMEADNSTVSGNTFSGSSSYAMLELWSDSVGITANQFSAAGSAAILDKVSHYDIANLVATNTLAGTVLIAGQNAVYASIQSAINSAAPGDVIQVSQGTYQEQVTINKTGLTLSGSTSGSTGTELQVAHSGTGFVVSAHDVIIEGFDINGPVDAPYTSFDWDAPAHANSYGIRVGSGYSPLIRNNLIRNLRTGISVTANSADTVITNNVIDNTKGSILLRTDVAEISDNSPGESGNEWDVVILASVHPASPTALTLLPFQDDSAAYGEAMMDLSGDNGYMSVLDRRYGSGNRTHAFIAQNANPGPGEDFGLGNGLGNARQPYGGIQHGLTAVANGGFVHVTAGSYIETVSITNSQVTLSGETGTILTGSIAITAPGVTVSAMEITNPGGTFGIFVDGADGTVIEDNHVHDIGTNANTHAQAIYLRGAVSNTRVQHNTLNSIGNADPTGTATNKGIFIGDSNASPASSIVISNNTISNVRADSADFSAGGRGAYGIQVNHETTGLAITSNTLSNLSGFWVHGIGLEANTPSASVTGNIITNLAATKSSPFADEAALFLENNPGSTTLDISGNHFAADMSFGVLLHPDNQTTDTVARHNFWGERRGPAVGASASTGVDFKPWFIDAEMSAVSTTPALLSITVQPSAFATTGEVIAGAPTVRLTDVAGDPVANASVTVQLSSGSFSAGNTTATTNASGLATFNNLVVTTPGIYMLRFSAGSVPVLSSSPVTVLAPEPEPQTPTEPEVTTDDVDNLIEEIEIPEDDSVSIPETAITAIGTAAQATTTLVTSLTGNIASTDNNTVIGAIGAIGNVAGLSGNAARNTTSTGNSQGAAASASSGKTALNNLSTLLTALDGKTNSTTTPAVALTTTQKAAVQQASVKAVTSAVNVLTALSGNTEDKKAVLKDLGKIVSSSANLGIALTTEQTASLLQATEQNTAAGTDLDSQLETSIPIKTQNKALLSRETLNAELGGNVSTEELDVFLQELAAAINPADVIVGGVSGGDALNEGFSEALAGASGSVAFDPDTGIIFFSFGGAEPVQTLSGLSLQALSSATNIPARVISANLVASTVPDGLRIRADGAAVITKHRIASIMVPASADPINFYSDLRALGFTTSAAEDGNITIRDAGLFFSGSFDFIGVTPGATTRTTTTYNAPTGADESDLNYHFTINYRDGSSQVIQPFIAADNFISSVRAMGLVIAIDRNSGVINAAGLRFRPSYFVQPVDAELTAYWQANKDATGIAYRTADINGDGQADIQVITEQQVQTAYGL